MAGNTFGKLFKLTTAGESHGPALVGILDGVPPNLPLSETDFIPDMDRRRPGKHQFVTARQESDKVQILSGVFNGKTTGTALSFIIYNTDQRSHDYQEIAHKFRPGHADLTYTQKYGNRDYRGGGRASARETAIRVAAGVVAKKILHQLFQVEIIGYVSQIGHITAQVDDTQLDANIINSNPFFAPNTQVAQEYEELLRTIKKQHDSIGAKLQLIVRNLPAGLGEPVFERLDAALAHALMGINAVKAVAIGDGFDVVQQLGSQHRDQCHIVDGKLQYLSNHAGGIIGGISTGQDLSITLAVKPTSSIAIPAQTINDKYQNCEISTKGRHDPCVGIRAVPIAEAMVALVLVDHLMQYQAQCQLLTNLQQETNG